MDELVEAYGEDFMRYVLALDADAQLGSELTEQQRFCISSLLPFAQRINSEQNAFLRAMIRDDIVSTLTAQGAPVIRELRVLCGGPKIETHQSGDVVHDLLYEALSDAYPGLLLKTESDLPDVQRGWSYLSSLMFRYPKGDALFTALLEDDAIKFLFPGAPDPSELADGRAELTEVMSNISWSDGSGGSFQLCMLPEVLIAAVFRRALLGGDKSLDAVRRLLPGVLEEVRRLARGKSVKVPTVIGLGNVKMPEGLEVEVYGGKVRAATELDKQWSLWQPRGSQEIHCVLETTTELKILSKTVWRPGEMTDDPDAFRKKMEAQWPAIERAHKASQQTINLSCFSLLLASKDRNFIATREVTRSIYNPLALMTPSSWRRDNFAVYPEVIIDDAAASEIKKWSTLVEKNFPDDLDLGMRRLLSATTSRLDPLDSFIDAVICWENAFGSAEGEVSFRMCGAIAKILEPHDQTLRAKLFKELKDELYKARSSLVHGGKEPNTRTAYQHRDRAIEIGISLMKAILTSESLHRAGTSTTRSKNVLLGMEQI